MLRLNVLLSVVFLCACASSSGVDPVPSPAIDELRWIDTLRELDERSDVVLSAAKFHTTRKELSELADTASHEHNERSAKIKEWRDRSFQNEPRAIALPACSEAGFAPTAAATALQIVERLIAHRECALAFAREALTNVRSSSARRVVEETIRVYESELQQLRTWSTAWQ